MSIKAVIFDMDGVLVDSEPVYYVAEAAIMKQLNVPFGEAQVTALTGASYRTLGATLRQWNPSLSATDAEIETLYIDALLAALQSIPHLIEGVAPLMERLKSQDILMAIGSSSHRKMVDYLVNTHHLSPFISAIVSGSDAPQGKPAPDIFLKCAAELGVSPEHCLVIEDSYNGVQAALNAGMTCAAFLGTQHHAFDLSGAQLSFNAYDEQAWQQLEALF